jgi:hypothetical protein
MMGLRRVFLGFFALISSCGPTAEGPGDTADVGPGTHPVATTAAPATPIVLEPLPGDGATAVTAFALPAMADATLVGFAGSRFAVIDTKSGTLVFDADSTTGFGVYGHPVRASVQTWDIWEIAGFHGDLLHSSVEVSADAKRMLVRTEHGIQAVDLGNRGALLAGWRGEALGAKISGDGETFGTWTDSEVTLVRIADGARVSYPLTLDANVEMTITWTPRSASWTDASGAHIVNRTTWRAQNVDLPGAGILSSKDGELAVVYRDAIKGAKGDATAPGVVEVWRNGAVRPAIHLTSAFVTNLILDENATKVAWVEYSDEYDARTQLHTLDVASGVHLRFASKAEHCSLTHESLLGIENGELRTDGECSPGCPSIARQSDFRAYDVSTGRVLRHWSGPVERPFNSELGEKTSVAEHLADRFAFGSARPLPMVHHPSSDVVLVERPDALRVADQVAGGAIATLESSSAFRAADTHFWPESGVRLVGVRDGEVAIWDSATGQRVWSSRR